jgi:hypothetical protein
MQTLLLLLILAALCIIITGGPGLVVWLYAVVTHWLWAHAHDRCPPDRDP